MKPVFDLTKFGVRELIAVRDAAAEDLGTGEHEILTLVDSLVQELEGRDEVDDEAYPDCTGTIT